MPDYLTETEVRRLIAEIEHRLKTDPHVPTRRYLAEKLFELTDLLQEQEGIAA
ncbi:hypothetical protein [Brucella intermedia]|uniref:hypothetical protein n=1 Tax=Brucella intermedia TaxID=94625 RepID=UPI00244E6F7A|nr:hypothetical protein [Brucella intermedia]WGJ07475.1 hypothetical protein QBQ48_04240 [Brucella intermedia]